MLSSSLFRCCLLHHAPTEKRCSPLPLAAGRDRHVWVIQFIESETSARFRVGQTDIVRSQKGAGSGHSLAIVATIAAPAVAASIAAPAVASNAVAPSVASPVASSVASAPTEAEAGDSRHQDDQQQQELQGGDRESEGAAGQMETPG